MMNKISITMTITFFGEYLVNVWTYIYIYTYILFFFFLIYFVVLCLACPCLAAFSLPSNQAYPLGLLQPGVLSCNRSSQCGYNLFPVMSVSHDQALSSGLCCQLSVGCGY